METKQPPQRLDGHGPSFTARQRATLIMAARRVLATIGPDATVEQVAKHADVSPATVENYFGSKESLLMTSLDRARPKRLGSYSRTRKGPTPGGADPSP